MDFRRKNQMSPLMQETKFRIVLAWPVAPLDVVLLIGQLAGYAADEPVIMCPEACVHEVLSAMSPVTWGSRNVLTWVMFSLAFLLHALCARVYLSSICRLGAPTSRRTS